MEEDRLIMVSAEVLRACCLKNGAIVASDTDDARYPKDAKSYRYIWPRDAAYSCLALDLLGEYELVDRFFTWCGERAYLEGGLFLENYHTNGAPNRQSGYPQLDQSGAVLWAIKNHLDLSGSLGEPALSLSRTLTDGLVNAWNGKGFDIECTDLWEERTAYPELDQMHSMSLAACAKGLSSSAEYLDDELALEASAQMADVIRNNQLIRTWGKIEDVRVDSSLLGHIWPFRVLEKDDERLWDVVEDIEAKLLINGCLMRYEGDEYDGWQRGVDTYKVGAGRWPLLNLWMAQALNELGEKERAREYVGWVRDHFTEDIPEQVFENDHQVSVSPLCWAHSLYLINSLS